MALVSLEQAQRHLRLSVTAAASPLSDEEADVSLKIEQATALVLNHLKREPTGWDVTTDPATDHEFAAVQAAILEVLGSLYGHRGDDNTVTDGPLSTRVIMMLSLLRDPALA